MHAKIRESFLFPAIMKSMSVSVLPAQHLFPTALISSHCSRFICVYLRNLRLVLGLPAAILRLSMHTTTPHPSVPAGTRHYPAHHARNPKRSSPEKTRTKTVRGCAFARWPLWAVLRAKLSRHKSAPEPQSSCLL